ncbi:MAG: hypothetical protein Q8K89_01385 [Actinomycetota bacterium]|nr:hypothetical protein [Actinomycetota bacterium]
MRRLVKTLILLALAGYVVTTGLPLVQAHGLVQMGNISDVANDVASGSADGTSVGALLGSLRSVDLTDQGATVKTVDGRDFTVNMDLGQMSKTISQPSGNGTNDIMKYGAIGVLLSRLLGLARGLLALLARVLRIAA